MCVRECLCLVLSLLESCVSVPIFRHSELVVASPALSGGSRLDVCFIKLSQGCGQAKAVRCCVRDCQAQCLCVRVNVHVPPCEHVPPGSFCNRLCRCGCSWVYCHNRSCCGDMV